MEALVEVRGLTKVYREGDVEHVVLRDVDAAIRPGEFAVLLGRSGSGKSTLLNLLGGIDVPTAGEVIVDGTSVTALSERERTLFRRRHIGFVFQFFNLISTLTVEENLRLPLELNAGTRQDGARRPRDLLELVGLADRAQSFPDRLSGGEQQRVAIVWALVHDPLLILADEPTGNLDEENGQTILNLLLELTRDAGKTLIMATHSAEVVPYADIVYHIHEGKLVSDT